MHETGPGLPVAWQVHITAIRLLEWNCVITAGTVV